MAMWSREPSGWLKTRPNQPTGGESGQPPRGPQTLRGHEGDVFLWQLELKQLIKRQKIHTQLC